MAGRSISFKPSSPIVLGNGIGLHAFPSLSTSSANIVNGGIPGQIRWKNGSVRIVSHARCRYGFPTDFRKKPFCRRCSQTIPHMMPQILMCENCEKMHRAVLLRNFDCIVLDVSLLVLFLLFDRVHAERRYQLYASVIFWQPSVQTVSRIAWPKPCPPIRPAIEGTVRPSETNGLETNEAETDGARSLKWERFARNVTYKVLTDQLISVEQYLRARSGMRWRAVTLD